jgi:hypothetical protein
MPTCWSFSLPRKLKFGATKGLLYERDEEFAKDLGIIFSSRFFDKAGAIRFSKIEHQATLAGTEGRFIQIGDGPPGAGTAVALDSSGCYA